MQYPERQCNDALECAKHTVSCFGNYLAFVPAKGIHSTAEPHLTTGCPHTLREERWQLRVAAGQVPRAVTLDGVFGLLLYAERVRADARGVGCVKAFHVAGKGFTLPRGNVAGGEPVCEGDVVASSCCELLERREEIVSVLIAFCLKTRAAARLTQHRSTTFYRVGMSFVDERPQLRRAAMHKLCAVLDHNAIRCAFSVDAAADARAGFQHENALAAFGQHARSSEARNAGTDDQQIFTKRSLRHGQKAGPSLRSG